MMRSNQMQIILACTHASINKCMYVHCMMIKQNHNKLNNKKYNFIVVFARTPHLPSSLRRWCCSPVDVVAILRGSASLLASRLSRAFLAPSCPPTKFASSRLFRCVGLSCQSPRRWRALVRCCSLERLYICGLRSWRRLYPPLNVWWTSGALRLLRVGGSTGSINLETR